MVNEKICLSTKLKKKQNKDFFDIFFKQKKIKTFSNNFVNINSNLLSFSKKGGHFSERARRFLFKTVYKVALNFIVTTI